MGNRTRMATGSQTLTALAADVSLVALVAGDSQVAPAAEDLPMRSMSLWPTIKMRRTALTADNSLAALAEDSLVALVAEDLTMRRSQKKTGLLNTSLTCSTSNRTRMA